MKIIVAGSRDYTDTTTMSEVLLEELERGPVDLIISGGARGPDTYAIYFANLAKIPVRVVRADWDTYGRAAGHIRNKEMAKEGDRLIAFWDGKSSGTQGMIDEMRRLKKPVRVVQKVY